MHDDLRCMGLESVKVYCSGRTNTNADALSCNPYLPAPQEGIGEGELQVVAVSSEPEASISKLTLVQVYLLPKTRKGNKYVLVPHKMALGLCSP